MPNLAHETVTFLLTDVQGSTRLWEREAAAMQSALARHDALADEIIAAHGGRLVKPRGEGDSLFAVFSHASHAVAAAGALQLAFQQETWPTSTPLTVRMALHTGEAIGREGDYYGPTVNRCARIRAVAHGGQILLSQATFSLAHDAVQNCGATAQDLSEHRLRDLERPERIYQLNWPGCPAEFPRLASLDTYRHNLPRHLTSFIGREREIAEVQRLLLHCPLVTITGSGGAGKTRLAQQVAAETLERYADGAWLVDMAALTDPELVPRVAAGVLDIAEEPGRPMLEILCTRLADKSLLLVLDNCEHLERACARFAQTLLRSCPGVHILATSRSRLGVGGEAAWALPSLLLPTDALPTVEAAMNCEAVRLFVDRAVASRSDFALTRTNLPATVHICRRLEGIPLAIELAAARVSVLTPEDIATRMENSFHLFKNSDRLALERHQTLRALIDWSYNLLEEPERILLRRLSVFIGGCTLEAVEQVCADDSLDAPDILDVLGELVHNSLVIADEQNGTQRYRLLETVRRYGAERLEQAGEAESLRARHCRYFIALATGALPYLSTSTQTVWLSRLEADHDNFRAALASTSDVETRLKLAGALWRFWMMHGHLAEGSGRLGEAIHEQTNVMPVTRSRALTGLGMLLIQRGDTAGAINALESALILRREGGERAEIAETVNILGIAARDAGNLDAARQYFAESMELCRQLDDAWGMAAASNNLGMVATDQRDYDAARAYHARSLSVYRELGDQARIASVLNNLGHLAGKQMDHPASALYFAEALDLFRVLDNPWNLAQALNNLASAYALMGQHKKALVCYAECLQKMLNLSYANYFYYPIKGLAEVTAHLGRHDLSARLIGVIDTQCDLAVPPLSLVEAGDIAQMTLSLQATLGTERLRNERQIGQTLAVAEIPLLLVRELTLDTT